MIFFVNLNVDFLYHLNFFIMSKTVDIQIEKSRNLLNGLKKHLNETGDKAISSEELLATAFELNELQARSKEVDALREDLNDKVKDVNHRLDEMKQRYAVQKKIIKGRYPMDRWADYGVPDKR